PESLRDGRAWLGRLTIESSSLAPRGYLVSGVSQPSLLRPTTATAEIRAWGRRMKQFKALPGMSAPSIYIPWIVRQRRYNRNQGIYRRRKLFLCPPACEAARLATYLHNLPWTRFITLT